MTGWFSLGLDTFRFLAAFGVALCHSTILAPCMRMFSPIDGEVMVLCFFVLSGYFIAYTTDWKKRDGMNYAVARLSRIYSVLIPALLLTELLVRCGYALDSDYYKHWIQQDFSRNLLTLFNLQTLWYLDWNPMSNHPLWSLAYECWYYLIFGLFCFLPKSKWRWGLIGLACLVAGPKILTLMIVWLMGVVCYRCHNRYKTVPWAARLGVILSLLPLIFFAFYAKENPLCPHYFSDGDGRLFKEILCGLCTMLIVFFLRDALPKSTPPQWCAKAAQGAAGFSFSLYVINYPVLLFGNVWPLSFSPELQTLVVNHMRVYSWLYFFGTIFFAWVFSLATERQKNTLPDG